MILTWVPGFDGGLEQHYRVRFQASGTSEHMYIDAKSVPFTIGGKYMYISVNLGMLTKLESSSLRSQLILAISSILSTTLLFSAGLKAETEYSFTVEGINSKGESGYMDGTVTATTGG